MIAVEDLKLVEIQKGHNCYDSYYYVKLGKVYIGTIYKFRNDISEGKWVTETHPFEIGNRFDTKEECLKNYSQFIKL